ncbi:hypothetical protein NEILACOT_04838 [Neisseria lactamica ATCC 23970]|uniref:Uncharacterized protein n=1 Tax=Neisseria lactamica ATCC 23970 TaxID=546265 RepID=D0WBB3_NEILA|nr:hypothetical protein NEILACOT_04838 [Neisseria lactamica ATCC 23970]
MPAPRLRHKVSPIIWKPRLHALDRPQTFEKLSAPNHKCRLKPFRRHFYSL